MGLTGVYWGPDLSTPNDTRLSDSTLQVTGHGKHPGERLYSIPQVVL